MIPVYKDKNGIDIWQMWSSNDGKKWVLDFEGSEKDILHKLSRKKGIGIFATVKPKTHNFHCEVH